MTEKYFEKPYWVIDFLPDQVPPKSAGQYFAVEKYYLRQQVLAGLRSRFTDILLKLNCYYDFQVIFPDESDQPVLNPAPEQLASCLKEAQKDLCILLPGEDALITLNHDDTCMTVYHPSETLLSRMKQLASAAGLFVWQPESQYGTAGNDEKGGKPV